MLPSLIPPIPGPRSRQMAKDLRQFESPGITYVDERFPVFWESASGSLVHDVDGNVFLDMCAAFGVAGVGHCHPRVVEAIRRQAGKLIHGMGDVHPPALKIELARRIAAIAPEGLQKVIFGSSGSDAVEAALKTSAIVTKKPGVLAFYGAYHGLSYGALNVTSRSDFRAPFLAQLGRFATHLPYPDCYRCPWGKSYPNCGIACLDSVEEALSNRASGATEIGAAIVEPIQGRGGIITPPDGWLTGLSEVCKKHGILLIADEIFTGCGRTGEWFASEVAPDLLCLGKALGGGFPISACIGTAAVMDAWGESSGEAIHTSTFLGSPLGCAAALAVLDVIEDEDLLEKCRTAGQRLKDGLEALKNRYPRIGDVRGRGLMIGIEMVDPSGASDSAGAVEIMFQALQRGVILLPAGSRGNVIELVPPYIIHEDQIVFALTTLDEILASEESLSSSSKSG
ncbi:MAG TPA: aspartate aminotransferase family protein [Armatimonadota bacterium]|nr:aspartate aminotransferase family protein [Armatimonadota bacterium]